MPTGVGASQSGDRARPGEATTKALATIGDAPHAIVLLFVDSEAGDQAEIVAGAYAVAGGTVPLTGGAAGGAANARFAEDVRCRTVSLPSRSEARRRSASGSRTAASHAEHRRS